MNFNKLAIWQATCFRVRPRLERLSSGTGSNNASQQNKFVNFIHLALILSSLIFRILTQLILSRSPSNWTRSMRCGRRLVFILPSSQMRKYSVNEVEKKVGIVIKLQSAERRAKNAGSLELPSAELSFRRRERARKKNVFSLRSHLMWWTRLNCRRRCHYAAVAQFSRCARPSLLRETCGHTFTEFLFFALSGPNDRKQCMRKEWQKNSQQQRRIKRRRQSVEIYNYVEYL